MSEIEGLPVDDYKPQSLLAIDTVNGNKVLEEQVLRRVDAIGLAGITDGLRPPADPRWLNIARTHFEQGFMALNRAVFQPERLRLPGDVA